jgi:hypothetical protein
MYHPVSPHLEPMPTGEAKAMADEMPFQYLASLNHMLLKGLLDPDEVASQLAHPDNMVRWESLREVITAKNIVHFVRVTSDRLVHDPYAESGSQKIISGKLGGLAVKPLGENRWTIAAELEMQDGTVVDVMLSSLNQDMPDTKTCFQPDLSLSTALD